MGNPAIQRSNPFVRIIRNIQEMVKAMTETEEETGIKLENADKEVLEKIKENACIEEIVSKYGGKMEGTSLKENLKVTKAPKIKKAEMKVEKKIEEKEKGGRSR